MTRWGTEVVGWLDLAGDERVLDAGCGTGQVTRELLQRLPNGNRRRARRLAFDDRTGSCAPRRGPGGVPGARSARSDAAPTGRRDPVHRHVPLGHGSRPAVRQPRRRTEARRAAGGSVRRGGATPNDWRPSSAILATTSRRTSSSRGRRRRGAGWSEPASIGSNAGCTTSRRRSRGATSSSTFGRSVWDRSWGGSRRRSGTMSCASPRSVSPTA